MRGHRKCATVDEVACAWGCIAPVTHLYRVPLGEVVEFGHLCEHHARAAADVGDPCWPLPAAPPVVSGEPE